MLSWGQCSQAKANRGILYVDEVNLLDDGLVDVILDSAASGVNTVEREGVSIQHSAAFIMIGSGNPQVRWVRLCEGVRGQQRVLSKLPHIRRKNTKKEKQCFQHLSSTFGWGNSIYTVRSKCALIGCCPHPFCSCRENEIQHLEAEPFNLCSLQLRSDT